MSCRSSWKDGNIAVSLFSKSKLHRHVDNKIIRQLDRKEEQWLESYKKDYKMLKSILSSKVVRKIITILPLQLIISQKYFSLII